MPRNYKELKVWQNSYQLSQEIDRVTDAFPENEGFILATQMKKAAVSIPKFIARGYRKKTTLEYIKLLYIAYRSTYELETHIILSGDLGYINKDQLSVLYRKISELEKMLRFMIKTLEKNCESKRTII